MTLNSIDWEEQIIIKDDDGLYRNVKIGEYIDNVINKNPKDTQYLGDIKNKEMNDTYYVDISKKEIYVPSINEKGKIEWKQVTALTKHLPINEDGTNTLVKITTDGGRSIIATKAKSFLTRINNKVQAIRGDEVKVGTYIPVVQQMPGFNTYDSLNMSKYFPKEEFIHGTEIKRANEFKQKQNNSGTRHWFKDYHNKEFTTPYRRQDSLNDVFKGRNEKVYDEGCIYSIHENKRCNTKFPDVFKLDELSGFFFGAYLAEGLATTNYIAISNNDKKFRSKIEEFCNRYNIGYHTQTQENKIQEGWTSIDTRIHCRLLAIFMEKVCNTGSNKKIVPDFAFGADIKFVKGLLNGYYSGDGSVSKNNGQITASSVSRKLVEGILLLLTRFGIYATISTPNKIKENNRGSKNILQHYSLYIGSGFNKIFYEKIGLLTDSKMKRLEFLKNFESSYPFGAKDIVPNVILSTGLLNMGRESLAEINPCIDSDEKILNEAIYSDVYYNKVIDIEEVQPTHKYVYDLTVEDNKTFCSSNGLLINDTFHHAGIGGKGTTALGVPRVKELLSISKNLKTPFMQIFLEKKYQHDPEMANKIASFIKYTAIGDLRSKIDVYYDPIPFKDKGFMDQDNVNNIFHSYNPGKYSCQSDINSLPWLMRIVFDREKMMNKEVTLLDIKSKFCNFWESRYANMKGLKKEERVLLEKVTQCAILSNNDNDKTPIIHLRFDMTNFDFGTIVNFTDVFIDNFKLKGINGIEDIHGTPEERMIKLDGDDEQVEVDKEHVIYTKGVNLLELRYINGIDFGRTICNDVAQIYETFGIEAARAALLREMKIVLEGAGNTVNFQHLSILVDVMTSTGSCISIDRHGINKIDTNPFARASFEKTVDQFLTAAVFGEKDSMNSVSSRIMAGLVVKGGTGVCNIRLDTELLEKSEFVEDMEEKYMKTFAGVTQDPVIKDVVEKEEEEDIFMPM